MNGFSRKPYGLEPHAASSFDGVLPSSRAMSNGYLQEAVDGFAPGQPPYNPLNESRPQSSPLVDLKDPIQVHLLTETALADSREWAILSQEEVDGLKKQCQSLSQRIEQTRANLAVQSKYRDAAISMAKLYSPTQTGKHRSLLSNRNSTEAGREAEAERQECERRCEDLSSELFLLEKRLMEPQRRLLEHTAGILQLTHKAAQSKGGMATGSNGMSTNGIPGSPESMYTYSNGRGSMDISGFGGDGLFDERSLYFPIDDPSRLEIPQKSPNRKETKELREEADRLRDTSQRLELECNQLRASNDSLMLELERVQAMANSEQSRQSDADAALEQLTSRLAAINSKIQRMVAGSGTSKASGEAVAPLPDVAGVASSLGPSQQLSWLEDTLPAMESEVERAAAAAETSLRERHDAEEANGILMSLWDTMQAGFAERARQRDELRASRAQIGLAAADDEQDLAVEDPIHIGQPYSINSFSTTVEWLFAQTSKLREQKAVLQRQIKQQRELNLKSDEDKDAALESKTLELENKALELQQAKRVAEDTQDQLAQTLLDLSEAREAQQTQTEREAQLDALQAKNADMQTVLAKAEANVTRLAAQVAEATTAQQAKDEELEKLNNLVVELKTEATIAKAELDGAYGSRAQRAADVAALAKSSKNEELHSQMDKIKEELASTLKAYEDLTKDTIAAEREKLELEGQLDDAQAARVALEAETRTTREKLEAEVAALREELDAHKLKIGPVAGGGASRAGASMLSEQFRATMKEERKKFQEELRNEQAQRRRLEDEVRALKRAAGPGKSPLSPR